MCLIHRPSRPFHRSRIRGAFLCATALALLAPAPSPDVPEAEPGGQHAEVLVVVNGASDTSVAIGEYYRTRRGVPASNLVRLALPAHADLANAGAETISRPAFERDVRDPIAAFLREHGLVEQIEMIVLAKGVPLRLASEWVPHADRLQRAPHASVDAELALLFSGRDGSEGVEGMVNPYFDADVPFAAFRAANPESPLRYLVTRLDGYQTPLDPETGIPRDIRSLVDRALEPMRTGTWLVDEDPEQGPERGAGNLVLLAPAGAALRGLGLTVFHDRLAGFRSGVPELVGYASWGSNDKSAPRRPYYGEIEGVRYPGTFAPRAVAVDVVSTNARSFVDPPDYGQSLCADLVRLGVGGTAGNVYEPMMSAVARPHILLRRYAQGVPAGEAYYRSLPYLGWVNVWVGDPLMRVEHPAPPGPDDLDGDEIPDVRDNCTQVPNADQRDTDADGFGNLCDADFDGDGVVGTTWGAWPYGDLDEIALRLRMGESRDADHDLDGSGRVDPRDLSIGQMGLFLPPGPSGLVSSGGAAASP